MPRRRRRGRRSPSFARPSRRRFRAPASSSRAAGSSVSRAFGPGETPKLPAGGGGAARGCRTGAERRAQSPASTARPRRRWTKRVYVMRRRRRRGRPAGSWGGPARHRLVHHLRAVSPFARDRAPSPVPRSCGRKAVRRELDPSPPSPREKKTFAVEPRARASPPLRAWRDGPARASPSEAPDGAGRSRTP